MKKSTLYSIICSSCFLASTGLTLIANGIEHATSSNDPINTIVATTNVLDDTPKSFTNNETVYIITDHSGTNTKSFIDNTLNSSVEPIPVDMHITYVLDNYEISGDELAGQSGHIKIIYDFSATKYHHDKKIPFLTVTSILLDSSKFQNITISNGKIISESAENTIIAGYTIAGLSEDLNVDLLPTTFSFEADVTNFSLDTTYTFATSEIFADLDTSKLNSIDDVVGSINQLSDGLNQIINGSDSLANGLTAATDGAKALQAGLNTLTSGANDLASGANSLASGAHALLDGISQLRNGLDQVVEVNNDVLGKAAALEGQIIQKATDFADRHHLSDDVRADLLEIISPATNYYNDIKDKVLTYTGGIATMADGAVALEDGATRLTDGADALAAGSTQLANGAQELSLGSSTLVSGLDQLSAGDHTLYNGLITFKEQGIDKLVSFANNDLTNLTNNIRSSISAAQSYHHYYNSNAKSVKFIFKTPAIK